MLSGRTHRSFLDLDEAERMLQSPAGAAGAGTAASAATRPGARAATTARGMHVDDAEMLLKTHSGSSSASAMSGASSTASSSSRRRSPAAAAAAVALEEARQARARGESVDSATTLRRESSSKRRPTMKRTPKNTVTVCVRVRPYMASMDGKESALPKLHIDEKSDAVQVPAAGGRAARNYKFHRVFGPDCKTRELYDGVFR